MAYQGKFSQPRSTKENTPVKPSAPRQASAAPKASPAPAPKREAPAAANAAPKHPAAPVKKTGKKRRKKKANRTVTLIFYTCYFALVAALLAGLLFLHSWLNDYLVKYEASQPTTRCEEIFQANFADPDWAALYTLAGLSDTQYESSEAFVTYMEKKVGTGELTYVETSAGLSGGHKYLLKLGEETIGSFTLENQAPKGADTADWQLGKVALTYAYGESVTIQKMDGITVYANGVALTDDQTIQIGTTRVEDYLPEGVHGPRIYTQYLEGLMVQPVITATDADGNSVDVSYDAENDRYVVLTTENTISSEEYDRVLGTAKTYALRMIEKASTKELGKYFDSNSATYKTIISIDPWMQEWFFRSYEWGQESITGYYRHSDNLFSVHVQLSMFVTRTDDTVKEYEIDHSFIFKKIGGAWKCTNMTNVDIREQTAIVRLTFKVGDNVVFTNLYAQDVNSLQVPTVTAPEGQVFAGWFRLDTNSDGSKEYTKVFDSDDSGIISLPSGTNLEPMTLYALFENASETGGNE